MNGTETDIRLDDEWALTQATDGDAPLCSHFECLYQNIVMEALTQKGGLFYDPDFGWSLFDFIQSEDNELTRLEIVQRARIGLQRRAVIPPESIQIAVSRTGDVLRLSCRFRFDGEPADRQLNLIIDAVHVEVVADDRQ